MTPFEPSLTTLSLPAVGGRLGTDPEHFVVEEIPAYAPSGEGDHLYVWIEKKLENTNDVARKLAQAAGVAPRDVGYAGLKDRRAVTRQWFSLPSNGKPVEAWELPESIRVLSSSRHKNKLRTGHLIGNRFILTLVDVPEGGLERAQAIWAELLERGLGNSFGPQRFGHGGRNLETALAWLQEGGQRNDEPQGKRAKHKRGRDSRFEDKMLPSVIQSEIFNRYLAARLARPEPLLPGEVVRLHNTSSHFVVEDVEKELPRLQSGDLHLTGPLPGPKTLQAQDSAAELEEEIIQSLELTPEMREKLAASAPGARRDLLLRPEGGQILEPAPGLLEVHFTLPSGSYATQVIREWTRSPWLETRG